MREELTATQLAWIINRTQRQYWETGVSELSDSEWDKIVEKLREKDPNHPILSTIGGKVGDVKHEEPMLSLQKVYTLEELVDWINSVARSPEEIFLLQPKYDGISGCYEADKGRMSTRGNGYTGEDITRHLGGIGFVESPEGKVLGEILVPYSRFEKYKNDYPDLSYKTPRNMVSGLLNQKCKLEDGYVWFIPHNFIGFTKAFRAQEATPGYLGVLIDVLKHSTKDIPLDGMVIKLCDSKYAKSLGATAHHPRSAMAFKFSTDTVTSKITAIEWLIGKNKLTPRATIEPVELGGVTVTHLTLHNAEHVIDNDITVGDVIALTRSGDVIPYYLRTEEKGQYHAVVPEVCPYCGNPVEWKGPEIICNNPECSVAERIEASCRALGIEGIGPATIQALVDTGKVTAFSDFLSLTAEDFLELEGFADTSAKAAEHAIESKLNTTFEQYLACLNIPNVGLSMAKNLTEVLTLDEFINGSWEDLAKAKGWGPKRVKAFENFYYDNYMEALAILNCLTIEETEQPKDAPTICFTGKMPEKRNYYEELAKTKGYLPVDSVSASLGLLVVSDINAKSSKLDKAKKLGIEIKELGDWLNE